MQSGARKKAIRKGRYNKKRQGVELDEEMIFEDYDPRIDIVETENRKNKRKKKKKEKQKTLDMEKAKSYIDMQKRIREE